MVEANSNTQTQATPKTMPAFHGSEDSDYDEEDDHIIGGDNNSTPAKTNAPDANKDKDYRTPCGGSDTKNTTPAGGNDGRDTGEDDGPTDSPPKNYEQRRGGGDRGDYDNHRQYDYNNDRRQDRGYG